VWFCLKFRFQQRFKNANLPKGNDHVAWACHTDRRVQQGTHSAVSGIGFQPIRMEMQRLRRCRTQHEHHAGNDQPWWDPTSDIALFVFHSINAC
jgi:hypothetical protein